MGFLNGKDKDGNLQIKVYYYSGLPRQYVRGAYRFTLDTDKRCLIIQDIIRKEKPAAILNFDKIKYCGKATEKTIQKPKVFRAALFGDIIGGGVGSIICALNAKPTTRIINCQSIGYRNKSGGMEYIKFTLYLNIHNKRFFKELNKYTNCEQKPQKTDNTPIEL